MVHVPQTDRLQREQEERVQFFRQSLHFTRLREGGVGDRLVRGIGTFRTNDVISFASEIRKFRRVSFEFVASLKIV